MNILDRVKQTIKIQEYAIFPLLGCLLFNCMIYSGIGQLMKNVHHYDLTTSLDQKIPFVPQWVVIYIGCFLFWAVGYILIASQGREQCYRFLTAEMSAKLICGIFFIVLPTTNVRPEILGTGWSEELLRMIYAMDAPVNLFPSIHCLVSWFCYIGVRGNKKIPKAYRIFACVFSILVFISTQTLKQHYLIDIAGGVFIAEATYYISCHCNLYRGLMAFYEGLNRRIWRAKYE